MESIAHDLPYHIPLAIVLVWCAVLSLLAKLGGWSALAEHYRADSDFDGPKRRFQSIGMERVRAMPVSINNVAEIGVDGQYLRLSMFLLFRPGHPPLKIPFSDLSAHERKLLLGSDVLMRTAREPSIGIVISRALAEWIAASSGGLFRLDPATAAATPVQGSKPSDARSLRIGRNS